MSRPCKSTACPSRRRISRPFTSKRIPGSDRATRSTNRISATVLDPQAATINGDRQGLVDLGHAYKQLDATVGAFGIAVVDADTKALAGGSRSNDGAYVRFENSLNSLTDDRDALALQISQALEAASFDGATVDHGTVETLIERAQQILDRAQQLGSGD